MNEREAARGAMLETHGSEIGGSVYTIKEFHARKRKMARGGRGKEGGTSTCECSVPSAKKEGARPHQRAVQLKNLNHLIYLMEDIR